MPEIPASIRLSINKWTLNVFETFMVYFWRRGRDSNTIPQWGRSVENKTLNHSVKRFQRGGRDSNPRWTEAHNGFRDRPIQPLWHLPIQPRNYNLNIHIIVQFGVKDILHVLFFQLLRQYFDRFFFAMHKEYFFDRSFYTCGILYK